MKHLGDITKISGYTVPIVDCVIGGSPCQDLSTAGKRAGLEGERSGLYIEQVRIVKEMREQDAKDGRSDVDIRPRYMVWENVAGAFSSGKPKGEDFRIVLEELAKVADQNATIPRPDKWQTSGCVMGDGWSIAWRLLDAQFWGVPQRRRRIALVADFGGQSAAEILFVRKGVSGNLEPGEPKRKEASRNVENCAGADDREGALSFSGCEGGGKGALVQEDMSATLACNNDQYLFQPCSVIALDRASFNQGENAQFNFDINENGVNSPLVARGPGAVCYGISSYASNAMMSKNPHSGIYEADTSRTLDLNGGNPACNQGGIAIVEPVGYDCYNQALTGDKAKTLNSAATDSDHLPCVVCCIDGDKIGKAERAGGSGLGIRDGDTMYTLTAKDAGSHAVCYSVENHPADSRVNIDESGKVQTLTSRMGTGGGNVPMVMQCYSKSKRAQSNTDFETWKESDTANTLNAFDIGDVRTSEVAVFVDTSHANEVARIDDIVGTLQARDYKGGKLVATRYILRRLTPLECERLQGFPDNWTDIGEWTDSTGKKRQTSDAARYKALGNSIALPPWKWVLKRLCACYERDATMASLFDGIGGFPYLWEQLNGKGSCLWASEIEEFPIAVTKRHFGE